MIYLDNAATSFPKPDEVICEVRRCLKSYCGNPGRGSHALSRISAEKIYETRELVSDLFSLGSPENVFFTYNDTYALNIILRGLLKKGDHVIISGAEHNSVYRPVADMKRKGIIDFDTFNFLQKSGKYTAREICASIRKLIKPNTKLLAATHISNVCSATLPVREIGEICRRHGIIFLLDAAQSAGHVDIDMQKMNIDVLCAPAHKGLFGIQGCGFAAIRSGLLPAPLIYGGSGLNSLDEDMPQESPERYEAGTLSVPAIAALGEGIKFVKSIGLSTIHSIECSLWERLYEALSTMPRVKIYAPGDIGPALLFNIDGIPSERVAEALDGYGICVRSGFHCAPLAHRALETGENGAVRASFGYFNTTRDVDSLYYALKKLY